MGRLRTWWTQTAQPRARRKDAVAAVSLDLDMWADYGDPAVLERAIATLRAAEC